MGLRRRAGQYAMGAIPKMHRSATEGVRSSLHYGGEGVLVHFSYQGV